MRVRFVLIALIVSCLAAVLVTGCVSAHGNKKAGDMQARAQIQKGKTTKQEVVGLLGIPGGRMDIQNGEQMYSYSYIRTKVRATTYIPIINLLFGGAKTESHSVSYTFDTNGIVKAVSEFDSGGSGMGLQDMNK